MVSSLEGESVEVDDLQFLDELGLSDLEDLDYVLDGPPVSQLEPDEAVPKPATTLFFLLSELLLCLTDYIDSPRELALLCRLNKTCENIFSKKLYQRVYLTYGHLSYDIDHLAANPRLVNTKAIFNAHEDDIDARTWLLKHFDPTMLLGTQVENLKELIFDPWVRQLNETDKSLLKLLGHLPNLTEFSARYLLLSTEVMSILKQRSPSLECLDIRALDDLGRPQFPAKELSRRSAAKVAFDACNFGSESFVGFKNLTSLSLPLLPYHQHCKLVDVLKASPGLQCLSFGSSNGTNAPPWILSDFCELYSRQGGQQLSLRQLVIGPGIALPGLGQGGDEIVPVHLSSLTKLHTLEDVGMLMQPALIGPTAYSMLCPRRLPNLRRVAYSCLTWALSDFLRHRANREYVEGLQLSFYDVHIEVGSRTRIEDIFSARQDSQMRDLNLQPRGLRLPLLAESKLISFPIMPSMEVFSVEAQAEVLVPSNLVFLWPMQELRCLWFKFQGEVMRPLKTKAFTLAPVLATNHKKLRLLGLGPWFWRIRRVNQEAQLELLTSWERNEAITEVFGEQELRHANIRTGE